MARCANLKILEILNRFLWEQNKHDDQNATVAKESLKELNEHQHVNNYVFVDLVTSSLKDKFIASVNTTFT